MAELEEVLHFAAEVVVQKWQLHGGGDHAAGIAYELVSKGVCIDVEVSVSAYAVLTSLKKIMGSILLDGSFVLPFPPFHNRKQLESFHEKVSF